MNAYIRTTDPTRYVYVPGNAVDPVRVVAAPTRWVEFDLTNTMKAAALAEARAAAAAAGLRLRNPKLIAKAH